MTITPAEDIARVYCQSKRPYATLEEAEAAAARHYACQICGPVSAVRMGAYRCTATPYDAPHHHTGHMSTSVRP